MIQITETAARKIRTLMAKQGIERGRTARRRQGRRLLGPELHVRVGEAGAARRRSVRGPGRREDLRRQEEPVFLNGTVLDYDTNLISKGFVFNNPNAKSTCGCGSSFGA